MKTTNITLAASLRSHGFPLQKIEIDNKRGVFHFNNIPEEEIESFDMGNCQVEPNAFHTNLKQLSELAMKRIKSNE